MAINTKYRTNEAEIMDNFLLQGEELLDALDKIASINKLLGGNRLTLHGVKQLLMKYNEHKEITITDVGCGNGDMLRILSDFGKKNNLKFNLIGIDANPYTIKHAEKMSEKYPEINYACIDIFSEKFKSINYDIVLCTLTLHHFKDNEIENIITIFKNNATIGVVINDLHRSKMAYRLFKIVSVLFGLKRMPREDGLISILRGFRRNELETFSKKLKLKRYSIHWKWAFRYQWIIYNI